MRRLRQALSRRRHLAGGREGTPPLLRLPEKNGEDVLSPLWLRKMSGGRSLRSPEPLFPPLSVFSRRRRSVQARRLNFRPWVRLSQVREQTPPLYICSSASGSDGLVLAVSAAFLRPLGGPGPAVLRGHIPDLAIGGPAGNEKKPGPQMVRALCSSRMWGPSQAVMSFRSSATVKSASVAAFTSSTVNSGLISVMTRPSLVTSITHISVMILVMQCTAV